jgi:hypothetical protein
VARSTNIAVAARRADDPMTGEYHCDLIGMTAHLAQLIESE